MGECGCVWACVWVGECVCVCEHLPTDGMAVAWIVCVHCVYVRVCACVCWRET